MKTVLKIKRLKSLIGETKKVRLTIKNLGLNKIGNISIVQDSASIRGMINKIQHIVSITRYRVQ